MDNNQTLHRLHELKRDLTKGTGSTSEPNEGANEYLQILPYLHHLQREIGAKAVRIHAQVQASAESPLKQKWERGLTIYETIRTRALPFHSPNQLDPQLLGSHRTILFWECLRFLSLIDNAQPGETVNSLYYQQYILPLISYFNSMNEGTPEDSQTRIYAAWQGKIASLRAAGAKSVHIRLNEVLFREHKADGYTNEVALILSLPYLLRTFIPIKDKLTLWTTDENPIAIAAFYRAVQKALVVKELKREARGTQET